MKLKSILITLTFGLSMTTFSQIDLSMVQFIEPTNDTVDFSVEYTNGCFSPMVHVFANGSGTVSSDEIAVCWVINNGTPQCRLYDSSAFTITWGMNLQPTYLDTICMNPCQSLELMCYISHPNDPNQSNDTLRITLQDNCPTLTTPEIQDLPVQIFPNPANTQINVRLNDQAEVLNVLSIDGRSMSSIQNPGKLEHVDLTTYTSGIYFIQILSNNQQYVSKFIKN
jgi:hypothetical protein